MYAESDSLQAIMDRLQRSRDFYEIGKMLVIGQSVRDLDVAVKRATSSFISLLSPFSLSFPVYSFLFAPPTFPVH